MFSLLSLILWSPIIGMLLILILPKNNESLIKYTALGSSLITFILTLLLYRMFDLDVGGMQGMSAEPIPWIGEFHIYYRLGVDGISLPMIILTGLLFLICMLSSWTINKSVKAYFALMLLLQSSVFGVFLSLDFFLFYVFWEVMLLPMFFLIGIWGGDNREYAAIKFFLYTFFGSILMLVGIIALYYASGQNSESFNILALGGGQFKDFPLNLFGTTWQLNKIIFWAMFVGFAIKVPMFPFHTWLPHAHVQAPTAVSVILAGVLLKMGSYGFLRISFPIFPYATVEFSQIIAILGLVSIIYGAFCAMAQDDMKRLIAYSSVSHMGFVMLGLSALTNQGMYGAVLQMFNHGTSTAMMFLLVGILYERSHHRWIVKPDGSRGFSGLYTQMPRYTVVFIIAMFASLGLPGLSGFISEALIFLGVFETYTTITCLAVFGLLIGAAYLLWMFKRMFFGEIINEVKHYTDMNAREILYMLPLCLAVIFFGIYPTPVLNIMKESVGNLLAQIARTGLIDIVGNF